MVDVIFELKVDLQKSIIFDVHEFLICATKFLNYPIRESDQFKKKTKL